MFRQNSSKYIWLIVAIPTISIFIFMIVNPTKEVFDHCICNDGSISYSNGSGTCSWHGGIDEKIYREIEKDLDFSDIFVALVNSLIGGPIIGVVIFFLITIMQPRNRT